MWKCHKCGKPVYFGKLKQECLCSIFLTKFMEILAERKQSLGYDWHPECLRCEECGKRLNPGQHAEVNKLF